MRKLTTEEWILNASITHQNKYDYSLAEYKNSKTKLDIICPIHGVFRQLAAIHVYGQGCPDCGNLTKGSNKLVPVETVLKKANLIHNNKYTYDISSYTRNSQKMKITCPIHGEFWQRVSDHISGSACPSCASNSRSSTKEFISKANLVHKDIYDYSLANYTTNNNSVIIICPEHGEFEQRASHHLCGTGCPDCAKNGFQPSKPAYLYYLKITTEDNNVLYKIGITNRTVNERFNLTDLSKIEIIKQRLYENGQDALDWETKLKRKYKEYQYQGPDILSSGNTELFIEDIIAMWYNIDRVMVY